MRAAVRINSCLRTGHTLAAVFLWVGIASLGAVTVRALPKDTVVAIINTGNEYVGGIVVSPDGQYVYGTNNDNNTVMVISTATHEVTSTIAVGNLPFGIAVSPDSSTLYVSNANDGTVSVIATATDTVTATVAVGHYPEQLAVSPDGNYVYVPNHDDSTVSIIDTATNTVSATIAVPRGVDQAGFSQSGLYAYAVSSGAAKVEGGGNPYLNVFDTSTQSLQSSIQFTSPFIGFYFAINPQGDEMYLIETAARVRDRVVLFNTDTNVIGGGAIKSPKIPFFLGFNAAVTPDGQYLYEPAGDSVNLFDLVGKTYVNSFKAGEYETNVAIAPDGNHAYFPDSLADKILVVDISPK